MNGVTSSDTIFQFWFIIAVDSIMWIIIINFGFIRYYGLSGGLGLHATMDSGTADSRFKYP